MDAINGNANADLEQKRREATLKEIKRLQGVNRRLQNMMIILIIVFVVAIGGGSYMASQGKLPFITGGVADTLKVVQHDTVYMAAESADQDIVGSSVMGGTYYAIQIGYYKQLKQIIPIKAQSDLEVYEKEGAKIFTLAKFNTYQEAGACKRLIKKVGFKDAFVIHYVDGERVTISDNE
ncbi:hypothetical protein K5X82_05420 [Halosquirtibacter xylanolyticus]|uniref:hypothetical protein n=1 Tax=Halosquirtibacter xylanolyticus TaxID=3374599 RepID=UPI0037494BA0|nr:hypothetical protein K5X82_05420 [Prolixibacteraceae bacterium]